MTSQGRACPVNVGVSRPKCPNKVGTARTHTHTHTHTESQTCMIAILTRLPTNKLMFCLHRKLTCPALLGVYQQVYEVRHRVWSCRSQDVTASHSPHRATLADVRIHQSTDEDKDQQEELEEKDSEKRDLDQWNDVQSDGQ